jgi:chromosome segregation ATPase
MADEYFTLQKDIDDSKKYAQMWEDVKLSFAQCKQDLAVATQQTEDLRAASVEKDKQLGELFSENSSLKKNNEVLRGRITELTAQVEQAQDAPEEAKRKIAELEAKCRDTESSFFDIQMENIRLKNEVDSLRKQLGRF